MHVNYFIVCGICTAFRIQTIKKNFIFNLYLYKNLQSIFIVLQFYTFINLIIQKKSIERG